MLVCCGTPPDASVDDTHLPYHTTHHQQRHPRRYDLEVMEEEEAAEDLGAPHPITDSFDAEASISHAEKEEGVVSGRQGPPAAPNTRTSPVPEVSPDRCQTRHGAPSVGGSGKNNSVRRDNSTPPHSTFEVSNSNLKANSSPNSTGWANKKRRKRSQQDVEEADGSGVEAPYETGAASAKRRPVQIPDDEGEGGDAAAGGIRHRAVAAALVMTPMKRREAREAKRRESEQAVVASPGGPLSSPGGQSASAAEADKPSPSHARQISWGKEGRGGGDADGPQQETAHANPDGTVEVVLHEAQHASESPKAKLEEVDDAAGAASSLAAVAVSGRPASLKYRPSPKAEASAGEHGGPSSSYPPGVGPSDSYGSSPPQIGPSDSYGYGGAGPYPPYRNSSYGYSPGRYLSYAPSWEGHSQSHVSASSSSGGRGSYDQAEDPDGNLITPPKDRGDAQASSSAPAPGAPGGAASSSNDSPAISHTESFERQWRAQESESATASSSRAYPPYRRPDYSPVRRPEGGQGQDHQDQGPYPSSSQDSQDYSGSSGGGGDYDGYYGGYYGYSPVRQPPSYPPPPRRYGAAAGGYEAAAPAPAAAISESFDTSDASARRGGEAPPTPSTPYTTPGTPYHERYGGSTGGNGEHWPSTPGSLPHLQSPHPHSDYSPPRSASTEAEYSGYYGHRDYPAGASKSRDDEDRQHEGGNHSDDEVHPLLKGYNPDQDSPSHKTLLTRVSGTGEEVAEGGPEGEGEKRTSPTRSTSGPKLPRSIISKSGKTARTAKALVKGTAPASPPGAAGGASSGSGGGGASVGSDSTPRASNVEGPGPIVTSALHVDDDKPANVAVGVNILTGAAALIQPKAASEVDFELTRPPKFPIEPPGTEAKYRTVADLNSHDVLLGRGGGTNTQAGNRRFRQLVQEFQPVYLMARRKEKPLLARTIVLIVRKRGGMFVKKDEVTGMMYEVGDEKAEAKTSQALREGLDVRATKSAANTLLKKDKQARREAAKKKRMEEKEKMGNSKRGKRKSKKIKEEEEDEHQDEGAMDEGQHEQHHQDEDDEDEAMEIVHDAEVSREGPPSPPSRSWSHDPSENSSQYDDQGSPSKGGAPPTPTSSYGPSSDYAAYNNKRPYSSSPPSGVSRGYSGQGGYGGYGGPYGSYYSGYYQGPHGPPPHARPPYYPPYGGGYQGHRPPPLASSSASASSGSRSGGGGGGSFDAGDPYRKRPRDAGAPYPPPPPPSYGYGYGRPPPPSYGGPHPPPPHPPPHYGYHGYPRHHAPPPPPEPSPLSAYNRQHHRTGPNPARDDEDDGSTAYPDFSPPRAKMVRGSSGATGTAAKE